MPHSIVLIIVWRQRVQLARLATYRFLITVSRGYFLRSIGVLRLLSFVFVAPPVSLENVMTVFKGVRNWRTTAKKLIRAYDDEDEYIDGGMNLSALQYRHYSDEDCLKEVVKRFLQGGGRYGPPSWRQVIGSLYESDEIHLAHQFRSYCEPVTGVLVDVCVYMTLYM